jgi:hypothetical protein
MCPTKYMPAAVTRTRMPPSSVMLATAAAQLVGAPDLFARLAPAHVDLDELFHDPVGRLHRTPLRDLRVENQSSVATR